MKIKSIFTLALVIAALVLSTGQQAQAQSFQEGDLVLHAGFGVGNTFNSYGSGTGIPIGVAAEYGITDFNTGSLGVGLDLGYQSMDFLNILFIGAKASYHFNDLLDLSNDAWDIYGGAGLYYRNFDYTGIGVNYSSGVYPAVHAGARYYFSEKVGAFGEVGNSWGWLKLGVAFKL